MMIKQLRLLSIAVPTLLSGSVFAQIEEITVTAQRREASLQDVPASVTALSAEVMAEKQITNVRDLYSVVPNLDIATNTGTASAARIFLRGIGEDESRGAVDQAVAIYVDDVYIGRSVGSLLDLLDLDRVEVLRGPQGTLYGRNSNGGAIKLVSKRPDTERSAYDLGFTVGSDGRLDARGTANLALSDTTAIRASLMSRSRDGFHDLNPNGDFAGQGREVGKSDVLGLRVALSSQLNDRWSLDLAIDHTQDDSDPIPDSRVPGADADNNIFTIEPEPGTSCSAATPLNFRPMGCFLDYSSEVETSGISATVSADFGGFTFRSLTGYREMEDELATRIGSPFFQQTDQEQISQEFTLTSNGDGPFNWVTGLYFYDEDVQLDSTFIFDFTVRTETTAAAIFAQGTYAVNDALNLTAGIRYTDEDRDITSSNLSLDGGTGVFSAERSLDNSESTYTLSADYSFSESVMAYVSYATGFKSGGASADCFSPTACFLPVDNEEVGTWEIGLRSTLLDDMVSLNLTYFNNDYEGLQIGATVPDLGFTRFNVDETTTEGIELESVIRFTDNFRVNVTAGWLDAEYDSVTEQQAGGLTNNGVPCPGGVSSIDCALGLELKNAPEFRGSVGALLTIPLAAGDVDIGVDAIFQDEYWALVANSPAHALIDVDTLINARVTYTTQDERWQAALWGRNLTDEEYYRAATAAGLTTYASPPLTWGVDVRFRF